MASTSFPQLFKLKPGNKVYSWSVEIIQENEKISIVTHHGFQDGKKVRHSKEVPKGKVNRTVLEQATQEANRQWVNKKEKELYSECLSAPEIQVRPMLAQTADITKVGVSGRGYSMSFPVMVQRKYDGIRCLAHKKDGRFILESRKGTPFDFPGLCADLEYMFSELPDTIYLDGELFSNKLSFETISGLVRLTKACKSHSGKKPPTEKQAAAIKVAEESHALKELIEFHVYDMFDMDKLDAPFNERCVALSSMIPGANNYREGNRCKLVDTHIAQKADDIKTMHDRFVNEGFEGLILRDSRGVYQVNKRSKYLQKYKEFMDAEFPIVGFHEGVGGEAGAVVWECITPEGAKFAVRPRGTFEERQRMFQNAAQYIGSELTVIFQEYSADNVPRFPVGKCIRIEGV